MQLKRKRILKKKNSQKVNKITEASMAFFYYYKQSNKNKKSTFYHQNKRKKCENIKLRNHNPGIVIGNESND